MTYPKHINPTKPRATGGRSREIDPSTGKRRTTGSIEVWARAPYNFVPLPEQIVPIPTSELGRHDEYEGNRLTGRITCTLTTKTPLYIRGMVKDSKEEAKNHPEFFTVDGKTPRIPGSSLRGMVRALIEIVSYSKMEWVTNEPLVYRAVAESATSPESSAIGIHYAEQLRPGNVPVMKAGYVMNKEGEWVIRPAQSLFGHAYGMVKTDHINGGHLWHMCKNAWEVCADRGTPNPIGLVFDTTQIKGRSSSNPSSSGSAPAVFFITGPAVGTANKYNYVFGEPETTVTKDLAITDDLVHRYKEQVSQKQREILYNNPKDKGAEYGALLDWQPVFYLTRLDSTGKEELVFFGHARNFRLPYNQSPFDLVPEDLHSANVVDMADALFGYVDRPVEPSTRMGSLSFTDGIYRSKDSPWLMTSSEPLQPHVLGSPKPTTFQHYLVQDASKGQPPHEPDCKPQLAHYDVPNDETAIRGHKLYWHKKGIVDERTLRAQGNTKDTQITKIKPVAAERTFEFEIHFENLTREQLGAVLWVLQLPKGCCQKLGMGKPLGMGTVQVEVAKMTVTRRHIKTTSNEAERGRYVFLFNKADTGWEDGEEDAVKEIPQLQRDFETFILNHLKPPKSAAPVKLADVPRVKMLLTMLQYPGPYDDDWTRYMGIQHQYPKNGHNYEVNEYLRRPVLPDPLHVESDTCIAHRVPQRCDEMKGKPGNGMRLADPIKDNAGITKLPTEKPKLPDDLQSIKPPVRIQKEKKPKYDVVETIMHKNDIVEEMVVKAKVLEITGKEYECDIGLGDQPIGRLPKDDVRKKLALGEEVVVRIVHRSPSGNVALTTKGIHLEPK